MDIGNVLSTFAEYFHNFDGAKALQVTYYSVALVLASIGLWKTILYAEGKMPKRLLEFASRFEGRIVEKKLKALDRIKAVPMVPQSSEYLDVNAEIDRALRYLDKDDPERAASELEQLTVRLEEKIKITQKQLLLTTQQTGSALLLFGSLARKVPQRTEQALIALKRSIELTPDDPEGHKEIGLLKKEAGDFPGARVFFESYWNAASAATKEKRNDKELLLIDACRLTAECHCLEGSPDKEKTELESALGLAEAINDGKMQPHSLKAAILEALAVNAHNRKKPQTDKIEEFADRSASEFKQAGRPDEAERMFQLKRELLKKSAA